jgi:hypothetical protein
MENKEENFVIVKQKCKCLFDVTKSSIGWARDVKVLSTIARRPIFLESKLYDYLYSQELNKYVISTPNSGNYTMLPDEFNRFFADVSTLRDDKINDLLN